MTSNTAGTDRGAGQAFSLSENRRGAANPRRRSLARTMKASLIAATILALPCAAEETPFAAPPLPGPGQPSTSLQSLSDIMGKTQLRHIKLWYAIKSKNWNLMAYELGHLRDTFETAVILYRNIPMEFIVAADKPLIALEDNIKSKDSVSLERSFANLTAECNTCHQAAQIGFIFIQTPTSSPFSNQRFAPKTK